MIGLGGLSIGRKYSVSEGNRQICSCVLYADKEVLHQSSTSEIYIKGFIGELLVDCMHGCSRGSTLI